MLSRAALLLTETMLLSLGSGGCRTQPPVAPAPVVAESESDPDEAASNAALAVCRRIYGASAGLLPGFDATTAAGEFVFCSRNGPQAGDDGDEVETMVLLQTKGGGNHYVQVDQGYVGSTNNCGSYNPQVDPDNLPDDDVSMNVRVERTKLGDTHALYVIQWSTESDRCSWRGFSNWDAAYRTTAWVQGERSTVLLSDCAWEVSSHEMLEQNCEIGTEIASSGAVITVSESSINLRLPILRQVITTRHYHQRGEVFVLEQTETKTREP